MEPMKDLALKLIRVFKGSEYTIGRLYINDKYFCDTLEDKDRGLKQSMPIKQLYELKKRGVTAIPTGQYEVSTKFVSPKYSTRPAYAFCKGKLPRLMNVPAYDGVLIHIGNTPKDTEGCILVGKNSIKGQVTNSTETFKKLYAILATAEHITITIE